MSSQDHSYKPRIGVVSGRYPASSFRSHINHRAYCDKHGYTYVYCNWPTGQANPYLNKIVYLKEYIDLFDYLFWIDDDAFFIDLEQPLGNFVPVEDQFLTVCKGPDNQKVKTFISSGQLFFKSGPVARAFLDEILHANLEQIRKWWPDELGYFTNGDQDSMIYLLRTDARFASFKLFSSTAFNSRIEDLLSGASVFVLHLTGGIPTKRKKLRMAKKHLRRGSSLLETPEEESLNIVPDWKVLLRRLRYGIPFLRNL